jgi:hypothetical protein
MDIDKNTQEIIRVQPTEFKGYQLVDIRVFYRDGDELKPTKKGITFKREMLTEVINCLKAVAEQSEAEKAVK